jgi:hypothetical protein
VTDLSLTGRDRQIVALIARFKQASSRQVHELLFTGVSYTPADRALKRLTDRGYLTRIERRTVGGSRGGSGQYVYGLGRRGYFMHYDGGSFRPGRVVNYHALAILDAYLVMVRKQRENRLDILGYSTEPDCWVKVAGDELKPDLFLELRRPTGNSIKLWLEIDMATEGQKQLRDKLARYWRVYQADELDEFPLVLWVAIDDERAKELRWLIGQEKPEAQKLFRVTTLADLPAILRG